MKNIKNKSINYGLKTLTVLAFVFIFMPLNRVAADYGTYAPYPTPVINPYPTTINVPVYYNYVPTPVVVPSPVVYYTPTTVVTRKVTAVETNTQNTTTNTTDSNTTPTTNSDSNAASDLASNAIFGSNGFLPSGVVQWILFAIFILIIIILIRRISGAKQKYEEEPLKHF